MSLLGPGRPAGCKRADAALTSALTFATRSVTCAAAHASPPFASPASRRPAAITAMATALLYKGWAIGVLTALSKAQVTLEDWAATA